MDEKEALDLLMRKESDQKLKNVLRQMKYKLSILEKYQILGTVSEIRDELLELKEYRALGAIDEVRQNTVKVDMIHVNDVLYWKCMGKTGKITVTKIYGKSVDLLDQNHIQIGQLMLEGVLENGDIVRFSGDRIGKTVFFTAA